MKSITVMLIGFAIIAAFAISDAIPISTENQETSTSSSSTSAPSSTPSASISTTTVQNDKEEEGSTEDSVAATAVPPETDASLNKNEVVYIAEIYTNPGVFLLVAEQRRFRFPYRRRFLKKQKDAWDDGFPALF
ncbi:hypothetical protein QE152_g37318 [Popillia japonica]|uniref:Uncharacterized protein n=1 Tax=Popillia japonica TaxID=7064 RepID=A0AAW1IB05_POPJA